MPRQPRRRPQPARRLAARSRHPASTAREARQESRVAEAEAIEQRIARDIADSLRLCAAQPERIADRLRELDEERSLEAALARGCSAVALGGILCGLIGGRRGLLLAALASGLLLRESTARERPPLAMLRRLGLRTNREIDQERTALKLLRGDFGQLTGEDAEELATAALKAIGR